jgi:hypothetical protein
MLAYGGTVQIPAIAQPINGRCFHIGVVPTPKSVPDTTPEDIANAYQETGKIAEVSMIWTNPAGIGEYAELRQNRVITALRVYG